MTNRKEPSIKKKVPFSYIFSKTDWTSTQLTYKRVIVKFIIIIIIIINNIITMIIIITIYLTLSLSEFFDGVL